MLNRIHVAMPKLRDGVDRPPVIPPGVEAARARRAAGDKRKTQKEMQEENGGAGECGGLGRGHRAAVVDEPGEPGSQDRVAHS